MSNQYDDLIRKAADKHGIDPARLKAHIDQESGFNPNALNSESGATGLGQFTPETAKAMGIDPKDPAQAIDAMGRLLAQNRASLGDDSKASAAYFGGPNPQRWGKKTEAYQAAIDAKTKQYQQAQEGGQGGAYLPDAVMRDLRTTASEQSGAYVPDSILRDLAGSKGSTTDNTMPRGSELQPTVAPSGETDEPGKVATFGAALGHAFGRSVMGVQQLVGKGLQQLDATKPAGDWLYKDATEGARRLDSEMAPYEEANPKTAFAGAVTGAVVNPVNKLVPMGTAGGLVKQIGTGMAQGAALSAITTPVTADDEAFLEQKVRQGLFGAVGGAAGSGLAYSIPKVIAHTAKVIGSLRSMANIGGSTATEKATTILGRQFMDLGVDVSKMEPTLFQGLRDQVADAIKSGKQINPEPLKRLMEAQTLPVPVPMLKGQVSRDPMQFAKEQNLRGIQGVGEPITDTLVRQNRALIDNLNSMGAKDAPSMRDAGERLIGALKGFAGQMHDDVNAAYAKVRLMDGQSAPMDVHAFTKSANQALDEAGRLGGFLPKSIENQFNDIATGKMPLTVDIAQRLDQIWGKEARSVGGSAEMAINIVRDALRKSPLSGGGADAMQAYSAAQTLARNRFATIESNPALKAVVDGVEPDQFVRRFVLGGSAAQVNKLMFMASKTDAGAADAIRATTLDWLKSRALNGASDENGVFSQAAFNKQLNDPAMAERLKAVFAPEQLSSLKQLGRVAENALLAPKASAVNSSNTASAGANILQAEARNGTVSQLLGVASKFPGLASAAANLQSAQQTARLRDLVAQATRPELGGTLKLDEAGMAALSRLSDLARRATVRAGVGAGGEVGRRNAQANTR